MTAKDKSEGSVLRPGGERWLLEGQGELSDDERALLLALISVDAETGAGLGEEERAVLDTLKSQVREFDADEVVRAVKHVVTAKPREGRRVEWPELRRGRGKRSSQA